MPEDSTAATLAHIHVVNSNILEVVNDLLLRAQRHDRSKLDFPEKAAFDAYSPKLKGTTYGSDEYKGHLAADAMQEALEHHYRINDHHPQHFVGVDTDGDGRIDQNRPRTGQVHGNIPIPLDAGVHGMNLIQMLEMLADWKAATSRHADGDLRASIEINAERFGYGEEIKNLLLYTAAYLGWLG